MDAHVDAFEERVQKRLAKARPADLSAFHAELTKFKADPITSLAALIRVPKPIPGDELIFNMFELEYPLPRALGKRPIEADDDAEARQVRQKTSEVDEEVVEDELGLTLRI